MGNNNVNTTFTGGGYRSVGGGNSQAQTLDKFSEQDSISLQFVQQALKFAELTDDEETFTTIEKVLKHAGSIENVVKSKTTMASLMNLTSSSSDPYMQKASQMLAEASDTISNGVNPINPTLGRDTSNRGRTATAYKAPTGEIVVGAEAKVKAEYDRASENYTTANLKWV